MKPFLKSLSVVTKPIDAEAYAGEADGDDEPFGVLLEMDFFQLRGRGGGLGLWATT